MAKKEERFEVTFRDGSHLCWKSGYGAAITPLLDSEGKIIVTR